MGGCNLDFGLGGGGGGLQSELGVCVQYELGNVGMQPKLGQEGGGTI